jgi:pyruvate kinase
MDSSAKGDNNTRVMLLLPHPEILAMTSEVEVGHALLVDDGKGQVDGYCKGRQTIIHGWIGFCLRQGSPMVVATD